VPTDPAETGAVTLALPQDVQAEAYDWPDELVARRVWHIPRPRPERPVTLADFKPRALQLGYVSLPRRQAQSLLEPAWVAILDPAGKQTSMGEVIAVPAAPDRSEPLFRPWRRARAQEGRSPPNASAG
jgi:hypothetical protein